MKNESNGLKRLLSKAHVKQDAESLSAFQAAFYQVYFKLIYLTILGYFLNEADAEDVTTDVIMNKIKLFHRPTSYFMERMDYMESFVVLVAKNQALTWIKRLQKEVAIDELEPDGEICQHHNSFELNSDIQQMFKCLTPAQQDAIRLIYLEGYKHREASEVMGISESASRQLVHRGMTKLRRLYGKR